MDKTAPRVKEEDLRLPTGAVHLLDIFFVKLKNFSKGLAEEPRASSPHHLLHTPQRK